MYNIKKSRLVALLAAAVIVGAALCLGIVLLVQNTGAAKTSISASEYKELKDMQARYLKLDEVYSAIKKNYYKEADDNDLIVGACKGMVAGLHDTYSSFMTKTEYEQWLGTVTGEYDGIGITFGKNDDNNAEIISVNNDSAAEKAGLKSGDIIVKIDGKTYDDINKMSTAIRGKAGTRVSITYSRENKQKTVMITRAHVVNKTVSSRLINGTVGYIKITAFEDKTYRDFKKALKSMENSNVKGLIIDLRNNGGGLVVQASNVADELLGKCNVTYMQDKHGVKQYLKSDANATKLPYVILVNEGTASASEIITAAVQDNKGGTVIGTKTYGKGIVQSTGQIKEGDAIELTIMQYFSPKGHTIHKKGIVPDKIVKQNDKTKEDEQMDEAVKELQE